MNRTLITLFGPAQNLASRQILLALNMNRVQNAISSNDIREILTTAQTLENNVLIYRVPIGYSISQPQTAETHRRLINNYTPYKPVIIYAYETMRPMPNDGRLLEEYCKTIGIDACWNPFAPVEKNEKMLADLLRLDLL